MNDQGMAAAEREEESDEGPGAEMRGWCGCETRVCAGWIGEDSRALRWLVECAWENSRGAGCTRHLYEKHWEIAP